MKSAVEPAICSFEAARNQSARWWSSRSGRRLCVIAGLRNMTVQLEEVAMPKGKGQATIKDVMHKFKAGTLHSGSKTGPKVTSRKQAVAIAISESKPSKGKSK